MSRQQRYKEVTGSEMTTEQLEKYEGKPLYVRKINGLSPTMISEDII